MNYLESIYCFLYQGRLDEGQPVSGKPTTGNIVLSVCFIMIFMGILLFLIAVIPSLADMVEDKLEDVFGRKSGKAIAKILVFFLMGIIYPIIHFSIGKDSSYKSIINTYDTLDEASKKQVVNKGKTFFYVSVAMLVIPVVIMMVTTFLG